jgi:hypothetical protein
VTDRWFSPGTLVSSINKTDHHDITEILLKVALNTITLTLQKNYLTIEHLFFFLISDQNGNNFIVICFSFGAVSEFNMAIRHNNVI